jgi:hypothetical protein
VGTILEISKVSTGNAAAAATSTFHTVNLSSSMNSSTGPLTSANASSATANANANAAQSSDDESSPIIFQIGPNSLQDNLAMDTIRIDAAASQDPFSIKQLNLKFVNVTIVPKEVMSLFLIKLILKKS